MKYPPGNEDADGIFSTKNSRKRTITIKLSLSIMNGGFSYTNTSSYTRAVNSSDTGLKNSFKARSEMCFASLFGFRLKTEVVRRVAATLIYFSPSNFQIQTLSV